MKRQGIHKPTVEDAIEISGIEILHPEGFELTKRTAELYELQLNLISGRNRKCFGKFVKTGMQKVIKA